MGPLAFALTIFAEFLKFFRFSKGFLFLSITIFDKNEPPLIWLKEEKDEE